MLTISDQKSTLDVAMIHQFLSQQAYWSKGIPRSVVEKAIANSVCFGAYLEQQQIGFARLVTDSATFAYLCDVFILPAWRGNGYSRELMQHIMAKPEIQALRRIVLVTGDAHGLYRQVGFVDLPHPERYMEVNRQDIYR